MTDRLTEAGFKHLLGAPRSIIGEELLLLHWTGATHRTVLMSKDEATAAIVDGWTRYRGSDAMIAERDQ